jgi:hypothetical protein
VGDVEQACACPDRLVFGHDRTVLHRHFPAGEIDHPSAMGDVPVVTGGVKQLISHCVQPIPRENFHPA